MNGLNWLFEKIDPHIAGWMERRGLFLLRISLAVIFVWFGALEIAGISPTNELVTRTV